FPPDRDPDEYDRLRRRVFWTMPSGIYVVGSRAGDRLNGMTCNWAVQLATEPKLLGVSVEQGAMTHELITAGGCFSLSVLAREDRALVRRFVKPATADPDASTLNDLPYRTAVTGAPILEQAVAWLDCRVRQQFDLGSHTLFAGEVVDAGFEREGADVLRMEDTRMSYGG
ncbi:MAG TPA: flavin reductase family protein, partial [Acidimicrobiales bacterium]|nr:flavin reductase family protein [Acidimicrobiales bacterium]